MSGERSPRAASGEEVVVTIDSLDDEGRGVGRAGGGLAVHVLGALPGETVRARVDHRSPHAPRAWASLAGLEGPASPVRVTAACPGHGACGGCPLQVLAYDAQLAWKRQRVAEALAGYPRLVGLGVEAVVASSHLVAYRNKAKYVVAEAGGRLVLGSFAPGTHDVVDMTGCQVPEAPLQDLAPAVVEALGPTGLSAYDEARRLGDLRHVVLRANDEGRILVVLVTRTDAPRERLTGWATRLLAAHPSIAGVVLNVNPTTGGALFGDEDHLLAGVAVLADRIGPVRLELSARAFFQVNRGQAARLYAAAAEAALAEPPPGGSAPRTVDLFCGVGGIALTMAARGASVVGIESHAGAVADARRSAAAQGLVERTRFEVADAADGLALAARHLGGLDAVVVNPPRKGLSSQVLEAVRAHPPARLVYVSCGPDSLARDLDVLVADGWRPATLRPFDLMPGTPHVETLAVLTRDGT